METCILIHRTLLVAHFNLGAQGRLPAFPQAPSLNPPWPPGAPGVAQAPFLLPTTGSETHVVGNQSLLAGSGGPWLWSGLPGGPSLVPPTKAWPAGGQVLTSRCPRAAAAVSQLQGGLLSPEKVALRPSPRLEPPPPA